MVCSKATYGDASFGSSHGSLYIRFPRSIFGGKIKRLHLGCKDTVENRQDNAKLLAVVNSDIATGNFDLTLEKYKPTHKKESHLAAVKDLYPDTTLQALWGQYVDYKSPKLKETTRRYMEASITRFIEKCPVSNPYHALQVREWLLNETTESMTKRVLTHINAAFKWGVKHKMIKTPNPYEGMSNELKHPYEKETKPNAFSEDEMEAVIKAFKIHQGNWNGRGYTGYSYSHYAPLVEFLFLTGCRPSEAIGLRWGDVSKDFRKITFNGGVVYVQGKSIRTQGSKNNKKRVFPCSERLRSLLKGIKPNNVSDSDLVFPSPKGKTINYSNFLNKPWHSVVDDIKPGTTPYSCRDTFISRQIAKGKPTEIICKWCDTSTEMISKHYFDEQSITAILPD